MKTFIRYVTIDDVTYRRYDCGTDGAGARILMDVPTVTAQALAAELLSGPPVLHVWGGETTDDDFWTVIYSDDV